MPELTSVDELAAACEDDSMCLWAAQTLTDGSGGRAWADERAVVVTCPDLSGRSRAVVWGEPAPVARLLAGVLPPLGEAYRLLGPAGLVGELTEELPGWQASGTFGWMNTPVDGGPDQAALAGDGQPVRWLGAEDVPRVNELLDRAFPDSSARPGAPGVRRWAGIEGRDGALAAVAADAWSAPAMGFMSGVAVDGSCRGRGLGQRVVAYVMADLLARHGRVALMVHGWNDQAIRLYQRLGLVYQAIRAGWTGPARRLSGRAGHKPGEQK